MLALPQRWPIPSYYTLVWAAATALSAIKPKGNSSRFFALVLAGNNCCLMWAHGAPDPMEKIVYITAQLLIPLCLYQGLNMALGGWRSFMGLTIYKADVLWALLKTVLLAVISRDKIQGHRLFPQISCCL